MKLLLDTHIWIWMSLEPDRLGDRVQQELRDHTNEVWLSPISTWEALLLCRKGKISLQPTPEVWVSRAVQDFREAPLTHEIVVVSQALRLHADPADRFLAATAKVLDLVLVTDDSLLLACGEIRCFRNR